MSAAMFPAAATSAVSDGEVAAVRRAIAMRFARRYRLNRALERALILLLGVDGVFLGVAVVMALQNPAFASQTLAIATLDEMRSSETAVVIGAAVALGQLMFAQLQRCIARHEQAVRVLKLLQANDPTMIEALRIVAARSRQAD